jgi:hypothetical protein
MTPLRRRWRCCLPLQAPWRACWHPDQGAAPEFVVRARWRSPLYGVISSCRLCRRREACHVPPCTAFRFVQPSSACVAQGMCVLRGAAGAARAACSESEKCAAGTKHRCASVTRHATAADRVGPGRVHVHCHCHQCHLAWSPHDQHWWTRRCVCSSKTETPCALHALSATALLRRDDASTRTRKSTAQLIKAGSQRHNARHRR